MQNGDLNAWHKRLKAKHEACELTLEEAALLCQLDIRNNLIHQSRTLAELTESQGVVEGVVQSVDGLLQAMHGPAYPGHQRGALTGGRPPMERDPLAALSEGGAG